MSRSRSTEPAPEPGAGPCPWLKPTGYKIGHASGIKSALGIEFRRNGRYGNSGIYPGAGAPLIPDAGSCDGALLILDAGSCDGALLILDAGSDDGAALILDAGSGAGAGRAPGPPLRCTRWRG